MRRNRVVAFFFILFVAADPGRLTAGDDASIGGLPTGDRWLSHLSQDLLPFWTMPAALGSPVGEFPSTRCDDGSLLDFKKPCPPIAGNYYLMTPALYLVPLSRQTYGYGVAYHLTGDPKYLTYMKAGVDYIRQHTIDLSGGMYTAKDLTSGAWGPKRELRNPQELGYGLLGMAFYYYLTRDDIVLQDILKIKDYIFHNYYNQSLGTVQWQLQSGGGALFNEKHLVADLDQMNTYLVLLTPILSEPYQTQWRETLIQDSHSILATFYSPSNNLFFLQADTPQERDLAYTGVDVGHSSKALWMIRWTGLQTGDQGMVSFAEFNARRLLDRAYISESDGSGSWAGGVLQGGALDKNKSWWVYDELDQLSATLALGDMTAGRHLPQTNDYWFKYFVDPQFGEVWNGVNYGTNTPQRDYPKSWQWKNAYHDMEHVLVGYLTSQWLHGVPATLHYAFQQTVDPGTIHPYYFSANIDSLVTTHDASGNSYQAVAFHPPAISSAPSVTLTSGASNLPGPLAAGSFASAWGSQLATSLSGTTVTVTDSAGTGRAAVVSYASPSQVNFRVPPDTASGAASINISSEGTVTTVAAQIAGAAPGIFQMNSSGLAAALVVRIRADQSQSIENVYQLGAGNAVVPVPIDLGPTTDKVYLSLFATGLANAKSMAVTVGGQSVPVLYAGAQEIYDGLDQVNVGPVPRSLIGSGNVNIVLVADGQTANPVELAVK
jgi:uncharacterized protein (TIGR03437 family)